jgi:hypothetical protein
MGEGCNRGASVVQASPPATAGRPRPAARDEGSRFMGDGSAEIGADRGVPRSRTRRVGGAERSEHPRNANATRKRAATAARAGSIELDEPIPAALRVSSRARIHDATGLYRAPSSCRCRDTVFLRAHVPGVAASLSPPSTLLVPLSRHGVSIGHRPPATDHWPPATVNRQPSNGHRPPAAGRGRPAVAGEDACTTGGRA